MDIITQPVYGGVTLSSAELPYYSVSRTLILLILLEKIPKEIFTFTYLYCLPNYCSYIKFKIDVHFYYLF